MGKRKRRPRAELPLFDLPLNPGEAESEGQGPTLLDGLALDSAPEPVPPEPSHEVAAKPAPEVLPSVPPAQEPVPALSEPPSEPAQSIGSDAAEVSEPLAGSPQLDLLDLAVGAEEDPTPGRVAATEGATGETDEKVRLGDRLLGGVADFAIQLLMLGLAITASHVLGVVVSVADWMPFALLSLAYSFLYWVVPLAFWGQTPGMAWVGHAARTLDGQPLSFQQAVLRWLGALLSLGLAGLPLLLAVRGRSLSDRLSKSVTVVT